jgi:hypothetical protein
MVRLVAALFLFASFAVAQSSAQQQFATEAPANGRYEIRQIGVDWVFRLDKYSGQVARMVQTPEGFRWEPMQVTGLQPTAQGQARFQLSTWANAETLSLLLDTFTGQTWKLSNQADGRTQLVWQPLVKSRVP